MKVLAWESDGFSIYYKRPKKGTYEFVPDATQGKGAIISYARLLLVLRDISLAPGALTSEI